VGEEQQIEELAQRLEHALHALGVDADVARDDITVGPTVVRFGIRPRETTPLDARGRPISDRDGNPLVVRTRVSRILALQSDLALALCVPSLRMQAPVPGQPYVGLEVPNPCHRPVTLREVLASEAFRRANTPMGLAVALGRDAAGHPRAADLAHFPHALIAGATGSGKSMCLHALICSLLATKTPGQVRLILIDPKLVEFPVYGDVPHLLMPVVTNADDAIEALSQAHAEMRRRYAIFAKVGVRSLQSYGRLRERELALELLPAIVIVVDELAHVMLEGTGKAAELLCSLAQLARAAGIHLVVATQRPSVDVVTGTIKANFPVRLAFAVASAADSRTILDGGGAEHLLGRGDMLFVGDDRAQPERIQACRVLDCEIEDLAEHWRRQQQPPDARARIDSKNLSWPPLAAASAPRGKLDRDATIEVTSPHG
jgi:DNA segregation ATPase FtsK/SpoIIIE-like protein